MSMQHLSISAISNPISTKHFWTQIFDLHFVRPKFLESKTIWTYWECLNVGTVPTYKMHNVGTVPMFKTHNVGTPKNFVTSILLDPNFWNPKLFGPKIILDLKFFLVLIFLDQNYFESKMLF